MAAGKTSATRLNRLAYNFVAGEVVADDNIARLQGWAEHLLNVGEERRTIDRAVEHQWCHQAIVAKTAEKRLSYANAHKAPGLQVDPDGACFGDVRTILLGRADALFSASGLTGRNVSHITGWLMLTPCSRFSQGTQSGDRGVRKSAP